MEYTLPLTLLMIVMVIAWIAFQVRSLNQRIAALEKQHLALVAELGSGPIKPVYDSALI